ncbi:SAM-dependent methyltransferase [Streptomyces uncialis]|uniref:SAM-dependent methyltransferase n=1 Tax=Streptomyces uncialis TaxID=1048205 RepID=UPI002256401A|nr:SAM-dependent methyltransferase [Streptomyces uncialis]MCX4659128.1 SAM-dependent methyltransferase [Streptomyces uncialis]
MTTAHQPVELEELGPEHFTQARAPRVYDCLLGGVDTYQCDRDAALDLYMAALWAALAARTNRHFTQTSTAAALRLGIRQFLDLGCGLPNRPNLHHLVPHRKPVVYVDRDPGVLAHAKCWLDPGPPYKTAVVAADLTDMRELLARPDVTGAFDLSQPIAVTVHDVLPWNEDDTTVTDAIAVLRGWLPTGSTLSITHLTDHFNAHTVPKAVAVYERHGITVRPRSPDQISAFFGGFTHLGSGLAAVSQWSAHGPNVYHFTPYPARASDCAAFAGIAVKT